METIKAAVSRVVFHSESSGFKVLHTRTQAGKMLIITGEFGPDIVPESTAEFHGDFKTHPKYGHQFKALSYTIEHNAEELLSIRMFLENIAPSIGPDRAERVVNHFKRDIIPVLDNNPDRLEEVDGIGKVCAENLKTAWVENRERWNSERVIYSLRAFLATLGIREKRIKRVLNHFGGHEYDAEQRIKENPYQLIELDGFGFSTVDFIARQLGIPEESPDRLKAFLIYCLRVVCPSYGHLYLTVPEIIHFISEHCTENNTLFLGRPLSEDDILRMLPELKEGVVVDGEKVYSKNQHFFEDESAQLLCRMATAKSDLIFLTKEAVEEYIDRFEHENSMQLSDEQRNALYYFAEKKVFVITGAPGTGKTLTLKAIVQLALSMRLNLTCMTPTGISAKKLSATINYDAFTIHRRLGFRGNQWTYNEMNQYETDIAIIDESSMCDQEVFYRLLSALKKRTHLILVGDHNQLPSVGAGNVLRELINCGQIPTVILDKIFRQNEASDIIKAAHQIIHGNTSLDYFKDDPKADIFFMRIKEVSDIERTVVALASKFKDSDPPRLFQIITPRNNGPASVDSLNQLLQESLNPPAPHLAEIKLPSSIIRVGDRVIVRKNDYENEIYNGDIGKVINIAAGIISIMVDDRIVTLSVEDIEDTIKLAYSITAHKSQGLEYPTVIITLINQHGRNLLQRNLFYTALTRAKEKVILIGHGAAVEKALNNTSVVRRNTALGERVCSHLRKKGSLLIPPSDPEISLPVNESVGQSSSEIDSFSPMVSTEES